MNWIPDDYRNPNAGAPTEAGARSESGGASTDATPPLPVDPVPQGKSGALPDLSPVALAAGLVGLLTGPWLIGDPTARYVILVADLVAIAFGALGVWTSFKRYARLDYAVAAIIMGGFSLFLWVSYVTDPPQGST